LTARSNEVATLTSAINAVRDNVKTQVSTNTVRLVQKATSVQVAKVVAANSGAMAAIEEAAEEVDAAPAFVQAALMVHGRLRASKRHLSAGDGRTAIAQVLKTSGDELKSTLLTALASRISADPFAKVKQLIQELIERLLQEAANEANQKGWCDKSIADAKQKRDYAAEEIADLNSQLAKFEASIGKLTETINTLDGEIIEINTARAEAEADRNNESAQNAATVSEADTGLDALKLVIQQLDRFYKTQAKNTVDLSLLQGKGPGDDAPDAGFDNGEAYRGAQSGAVGIIAMLDVMKGDFVRTIEETKAAEAQAVRDYTEFLTVSGSSLAQKTEAKNQATSERQDIMDKESTAKTDLDTQQTLLETAIGELKDLHPVCIATGMTYDDRVKKREEEIEALNKAMCIFNNFEKYGPDAGSSGC